MKFKGIFDDLLEFDKLYINDCYSSILFTYIELERANKLGLYNFKVKNKKVIISNENNYKRNIKALEKKFEEIKMILPPDTKLINIPKHPSELKKELWERLLRQDINEDRIKPIIQCLFGAEREPKKNEKDKFKFFLAKHLKIKGQAKF